MSIESSLKSIGNQLFRLEMNLVRLRKQSVDSDTLATPPRIYLRGYFQSFDPETQRISLNVSGSEELYPLSSYNGAWLPMPQQQVIITRTHSFAPARSAIDFSESEDPYGEARKRGAPQITAFAARGKAIPEAPRVRLIVDGYDPVNRSLKLIDPEGGVHNLVLPETFSTYYSPNIRNGQVLAFRVVRVPPVRYFIPLLTESYHDGPSAEEFLQSI